MTEDVAGRSAPGRLSPFAFDVAIACVLTVFAQLNLRFHIDQSTVYGSGAAASAATAVATAALAFRRRAPLATMCVVAAAVALPELATTLTTTLWGDFVPMLIATYSVARYAKQRQAIIGGAVALAALIIVFVRVPSIGTASNIPFTLVPFVGLFATGRVLRGRAASHEEARSRAQRLEAEREESIRVAVAEERSRIARELHDIVAHCVSVMVVQAGAAEDLLDRDPAGAHAPLRSVQETGRQTVAELQRMLGLLRGEGAVPALKPQPGTDQLAALVEQMNEVGLPVTLTVEGTVRSLPPGVELAVYRIAQEALTNTVKHAGRANAAVRLRYTEHCVELEVVDDGRGGQVAGTGHGLIGMQERASLYGGSLTVGPRPGGGFGVRAALPVDGTVG